jgi:protein SCO1/2
LALLLSLAGAPAAPATPSPLQGVDIVEQLGSPVPLDVPLVDASGHRVRLRDVVSGTRPIVLTLVYYRCPMLCNVVLGALVRGLRQLADLGLALGDRYEAVTVSFDPRETSADAAERQHGFLQSLGYPERAGAWHFLTGAEPDLRALAGSVGFRYRFDPSTGQYAHAAAIFVLTPQGRVSRYLYGVEFPARQLQLSLVEASAGRAGTSFERVLLSCYRWDPARRRYGLYVMGFVRLGSVLCAALLFGLLGRYWWREAAHRRARRATQTVAGSDRERTA